MDPNNRKGKEREKRKTVQEKFVVYSNKAKRIREGRVREHAQEFSSTLEQKEEDKEKRQICKTSCIHILCIVKAAN